MISSNRTTEQDAGQYREPHLLVAFLPIILLVGFLTINVKLYGDSATSGPNQMALIFSAAFAGLLSWKLGFKWEKLRDGIVNSIIAALPAVLILLMIGALAGTWMISGIVPSMIYYGLKILHPSIFLLAATVVCAIVSLATGSSWSTVATVGAALLGIGTAMGFHEGMIAGAIISGAYFGDKMSPLSDTTNLAPAMAGTDLFTHIRYMSITTIPSLAIALLIFFILGFTAELTPVSGGVDSLLHAIEGKFYVSPVLFFVPVAVIFLIIKKVDAVPALFIGTLLGGIFAVIFQPQIVTEISGTAGDYLQSSYSAILESMMGPVSVTTTNDQVNGLLASKGMGGMLNTIWLIICAMSFGGVMEVTGMLRKISSTVVSFAKTTGSLIASTAATCIFFNATAADQYLSIVVPGRMYARTYRERGLKPENLSRTLEDSGTVTSVLFPWNTCGATQAGVLGVATGTYWMYCFFNLISPIMTMIVAFMNYRIARYTPEELTNQE